MSPVNSLRQAMLYERKSTIFCVFQIVLTNACLLLTLRAIIFCCEALSVRLYYKIITVSNWISQSTGLGCRISLKHSYDSSIDFSAYQPFHANDFAVG